MPLAEQQNAVVIAEALEGGCFLSASFNRVMHSMRAKWQHCPQPPITVLNFSCDLYDLYRNRSLDAHWRVLKNKSQWWRNRERPPTSAKDQDGNPIDTSKVKSIATMISQDENFKEAGRADLDSMVHARRRSTCDRH